MFNGYKISKVKILGLATALTTAYLQWQAGDIAGAVGIVAASLSSPSLVTADVG